MNDDNFQNTYSSAFQNVLVPTHITHTHTPAPPPAPPTSPLSLLIPKIIPRPTATHAQSISLIMPPVSSEDIHGGAAQAKCWNAVNVG